MKTTGMVRRIDELGRIVIPKEIRKQLMMKEGESISFSLEEDKIILTKFSMLNKLSPVIQSLLEGLYQQYHNSFLVCDLNQIMMASSQALSTYQRKLLSQEMQLLLQQEKTIEKEIFFLDETKKISFFPLKKELKVIGALMMISEQTPYYLIEESLIDFVKNVIEQEIESCV